jgi:3-deoxy-D-manno-octulosonic-acid transferase
MDNFTSESRMLRENGGACAVRDGADLRVTLEKLLSDPVCRRTMGERARQAVEQQKGALARSAAIIRSLMPGTGR